MSYTLRRAVVDDSYDVFLLFDETFADLLWRLGSKELHQPDPSDLAAMWGDRRELYEHLARTADQFWLAERGGRLAGFARSIVRDGVQMLTEFFVRPDAQGAGVGSALLEKAMPDVGAARRIIIASPDVRAHAHYLKLGLTPRFPVYYFGKTPEFVEVATDLTFVEVFDSAETLETLATLDRAVLGHRRDEDHRFLLGERRCILALRGGEVVGYGYCGGRNGPFALRDGSDFPAFLAHAENRAVGAYAHFGVEAPGVNASAIDYLLGHGFRIDWFVTTFMSDGPVGGIENYLITSPPFFL